NTRRIRGALQPLLRAAPLSKSAVSRVTATLKDRLEVWRTRSLADLDVVYVYLDAFALRVRSAGRVVSAPMLGVVGVLSDGRKQLLALELSWRRIVRRVERVPGQSCGARVASADPGDHRRQRWTAARRRGSLAGRGRATLLRTQAAQSGAE